LRKKPEAVKLAVRQATAGAGSNKQEVRGRYLSRKPDAEMLAGNRKRGQSLGGRQGQNLRSKPDAIILALTSREPQVQVVMNRPNGQKLRRKPVAVNLALAGRVPQTQAVMCRPAGTDVCAGSQTQ
jgi:hypothetical protein